MIALLTISVPGMLIFSSLVIVVLLVAFFGGIPKVVDSINRHRGMSD